MQAFIHESNNYDFDYICEKMRNVCPEVISSITKFNNNTLAEYSGYIWREVEQCKSEICERSRLILYKCLENEIKSQTTNHVEDAISEFKMRPVFQTGPHCQLILDRCNLLTAIFSLMGIDSFNGKYYFLSNCATPTMELRPRVGPAWLNIYDSNINVFNLSRIKRKGTSVFCINEPLNFEMKVNYGKNNIDEVETFVYKYKSIIGDKTYYSAVDAFNSANRNIWNLWDCENRYIPIFLDEGFYCNLLIEHLLDKENYIYKIFSDRSLQEKIMYLLDKEKDNICSSMIPMQTDFLWYISDNKVKPIKFKDGKIIICDKEEIIIENNIDNIIKLLVQKKVVPNIFIIISMVSFLANTRLNGGLHQVAYYPVYQKIFNQLLEHSIKDENELRKFLNKTYNYEWGTHVLEEDVEVIKMFKDYKDGFQIKEMLNLYKDKKLCDCIKDLHEFRSYHRWANIIFGKS